MAERNAWWGSMRGSGVHGSGGVCDRGHTSCGRVWWRACVAGGMHGRGRGACVAGETATAAGCTHPTGMHSSS